MTNIVPASPENTSASILHEVNIVVKIPNLELTFYIVSPEQIDAYSESGVLFDVCVTLIGISVGAAIGFWTALKQGGISPEGVATLDTAKLAAIAFGMIFSLGAIWFFNRKRYLKKQWRTSSFQPNTKNNSIG